MPLGSAGFLASPSCNDKELSRALERHQADWRNTPLAKLQAPPDYSTPVTKWSHRDEAFLSIARGTREVAKRLAERPGRVAGAAGKPGGPPTPTPAPALASALSPLMPSSTHPVAAVALEIPVGPVPLDSAFYIYPADEVRCTAELDKPGALIRIKGPMRFGKKSLFVRLLAHANGKGCAAVGKGLGLRMRKEE
ncbi:MAG: AAA-like domain-containing protein [Cyanobium sp.]